MPVLVLVLAGEAVALVVADEDGWEDSRWRSG